MGRGRVQPEVYANVLGDLHGGGLDAGDHAVLVHGHEATANVGGRRLQDLAVLDEGELGSAAADIDIEDGVAALLGHADGAGAVSGHDGFEVVACGGADELSSLAGKQVGD